ncbi:hypothetical protein Desku_1045 [Desulfofundulus kuznetsovii DSM 6115]|uniref:Uncharacterized protein n=1 Tax=Desulfofundulus kuznetsovii (strain DSM 6115 / VKM B-1805 / 17) TaxID=760568 RepID=A0AAU8PP42_DESK7|nr:hypothetical protein Desku_1045 [Desulfofundulus kuznetsovii DSM 6115]
MSNRPLAHKSIGLQVIDEGVTIADELITVTDGQSTSGSGGVIHGIDPQAEPEGTEGRRMPARVMRQNSEIKEVLRVRIREKSVDRSYYLTGIFSYLLAEKRKPAA